MQVRHVVLELNGVVKALPKPENFMHKDRVCFQYAIVEKKVKVIKERWCHPMELECVRRSSPRHHQVRTHVENLGSSRQGKSDSCQTGL